MDNQYINAGVHASHGKTILGVGVLLVEENSLTALFEAQWGTKNPSLCEAVQSTELTESITEESCDSIDQSSSKKRKYLIAKRALIRMAFPKAMDLVFIYRRKSVFHAIFSIRNTKS
ncbi:hypothetical protein VTL71DRAFT_13827 [Oculimacula yallundae]|uniref:Uncharacterized protein n=1 Tax=Oculimacula yallundae TaxID=86028 RepID=A0ABR4CNL3_9HELO